MNSASSPDDAAEIASQIVGTWRYEAAEEPTGFAYLHYTECGRVFQFVPNPDRLGKRFAMGLWVSVETACQMRIRAKGSPDGWVVNFSYDGTILTLIPLPHRSYPCSRVPPGEIPEWFRDSLDKELARQA